VPGKKKKKILRKKFNAEETVKACCRLLWSTAEWSYAHTPTLPFTMITSAFYQ